MSKFQYLQRRARFRLISSTREVVARLEVMFNHEEEDEPDIPRGRSEGMSLLDKMTIWNSKAGQDLSVIPNDNFFEGVKDDEEDSIDQSDLSAYHQIILDSSAYKWFLMSLKNESILQLVTSERRIRQIILDKLPTGTISKQRTPNFHEVTFNLEWQHAMEEKLRHELSEELKGPYRSPREPIVMTGSPREMQGLTIRQYLTQTWPTNGFQIFNALQRTIMNFDKKFSGKSATLTQL